MLDQQINANFLYPLVILLLLASTELGFRIGRRVRGKVSRTDDVGTLTASTLGLLALLLAFSLSHALSRYETRRDLVLEEADAIESTAHLALMLPQRAQEPTLALLREYVAVRIGLGIPYDPMKVERDFATSTDLLAKMWKEAATVSDPQSLSAHRFVVSLDEMTKVQERRITAHRYHVPNAVLLTLVGVAVVALAFTGYQSGLSETRLRMANLIMAATVAVVAVLVVDLDQPARGLITVPNQPLIEIATNIPSSNASTAAR
jgi:hypothetical protein